MHGRVWRADGVVSPLTGTDGLSAAFAERTSVLFLEVAPDELPEVAGILGLHSNAVEDAVREPAPYDELRQRTKYERYPGHVFLYLYAAHLDLTPLGEPESEQEGMRLIGVPVFVSRQFLVLVDRGGLGSSALIRHWDQQPQQSSIHQHGTAGLLHTVLDQIVDSHLSATDELTERVDLLEDTVFEGPTDLDPRQLQRSSYATRKSLVRLWRVAGPMREVVLSAMRGDEDAEVDVDTATMRLYQDVYDHTIRVVENLEGLRELLATLYEARIALADHSLNTVTKKLAAWAAIIAVPTAVTGFYGQNLAYPGFGTHWGFVFSTALWGGVALFLYVLFRRRRWL